MKRVYATNSIAEAVALKSHLESEGFDAAVEEGRFAGIALIPDLSSIYGVKNAPEGFIEFAKRDGAVEVSPGDPPRSISSTGDRESAVRPAPLEEDGSSP